MATAHSTHAQMYSFNGGRHCLYCMLLLLLLL